MTLEVLGNLVGMVASPRDLLMVADEKGLENQ
jgi:hypothetical protein